MFLFPEPNQVVKAHRFLHLTQFCCRNHFTGQFMKIGASEDHSHQPLMQVKTLHGKEIMRHKRNPEMLLYKCCIGINWVFKISYLA